MRTNLCRAAAIAAVCVGLLPPPAGGQGSELTLTATSANVAGPGSPVRIRIARWSTQEERTPLIAAMNPPPPTAAAAAGERGDGRGARAGGRGGRGGGRGGRGEAAVPLTPIAALTAAISRAPSLGYIWTTDATGYSIKYAYRAPLPDGGERIILATDRRLGTHAAAWQPVTAGPLTDYEFTLLELRLGPTGGGEARTSLTTPVVVDKDAGTIALENYAAAPPILQNVKRAGR